MSYQRIPAAALILLLVPLIRASSLQAQFPAVPQLNVDVDIVQVNATVTESERNRSVLGLNQEDFQIWEDKIEQTIKYFSSEDVPLSVGVILDISGSMKGKIDTAQSAAARFLKSGTREDEYFQIQFSDRLELTSDFTSDIGKLQSLLLVPSVKGSTALYDAVYLGLNKLRESHNQKKALLLITDGEDNHSRYSFSNVRDFIREQDVQMYAIGIVDPVTGVGEDALLQLADITGGRAFFPTNVADLPDICRKIAAELKYQYVLGYQSTNRAKDGSWRKIRVKVTAPEGSRATSLDVRARPGYLAPGGGDSDMNGSR